MYGRRPHLVDKSRKAKASALIFIHKSISAAKLPYREAVRDHSPGLPGLGLEFGHLGGVFQAAALRVALAIGEE